MNTQKTWILSLVSNKNLSEILPCSSWAQGEVTSTKMAKNLTWLWRHPQKNKPKTKKYFFSAD